MGSNFLSTLLIFYYNRDIVEACLSLKLINLCKNDTGNLAFINP